MEGGSMPNRNVLFVDDDALIARLAALTLERMGHRVTTCADADAALDTFRRAPGDFDLVVADLRLGATSGFDLCAEVRRIRPDQRIVVTSGLVGTPEQARARALGLAIVPKSEALATLPRLLD
jgi:two-component system cell cycle sensor histidine kinase/response regulator CckA